VSRPICLIPGCARAPNPDHYVDEHEPQPRCTCGQTMTVEHAPGCVLSENIRGWDDTRVWCPLQGRFATEQECTTSCAAPEQRVVCAMERKL
jgi:hypothetical protein